MKIPFFEDFGKANDIFKADNYALNKTIQVTSKNSFGKLKTKTVVDDKRVKNKFTFTKAVEKVGDVELVTSGSDLSVEVGNGDLFANTKVTGKLESIKDKSWEVDAEYTTENMVGQMETKCSKKGDMSSMLSMVVGYDGVSVGIQAELSPGEDGGFTDFISDYNAAVDWQVDSDNTISLKTSQCCDAATATFWKRFSDRGEIAGRLKYDFLLKQRSVDVGTKLSYGKATIMSMLGSNGVASLSYKRPLSDSVTASLATQCNVADGSAWTSSWKLEFTG